MNAWKDDYNRTGERRSPGLGMGAVVAVAGMLVLGLMFWGMTDKTSTTDNDAKINAGPTTTTGSAPAAPASSPGR